MSSIVEDRNRNVVPRWRSLSATIQLGELNGKQAANLATRGADEWHQERLQTWLDRKDWIAASDFVGGAITIGRREEAVDAARHILQDINASQGARMVARVALGLPLDHDRLNLPTDPVDAIRRLRERVIANPKNPFIHSELARQYTLLSQIEPARKAMTIALALSPRNRYLLRVGSRFFLHIGEHDRAHDILTKSSLVAEDPWVLAAEIATSLSVGRASKHVQRAKHMLSSSSFTRHSVSELFSAVGTLDMTAGNPRFAKRSFKSALDDPTENAVAQAVWADRQIGGISVSPEQLALPQSFEAQMWHHVAEHDWTSAYYSSVKWLDDQPFSSRPAIRASYLSVVALGDFKACIETASRGIQANPTDTILLNNLVVGLSLSGEIQEAQANLERLISLLGDGESDVTALATTGLVRFRQGLAAEGRALYLKAVKHLESMGSHRQCLLARLFWAREERRADPQGSTAFVNQVLDDARKDLTGEFSAFVAELEGKPQQLAPGAAELKSWANQISDGTVGP